jgi:hypothetical protein
MLFAHWAATLSMARPLQPQDPKIEEDKAERVEL